jgi:hypothetical protein
VGTRFQLKSAQNIYNLAAVSTLVQRTNNKIKPMQDISNAVFASRSQLNEVAQIVQTQLTGETVNNETAVFVTANILPIVNQQIQAVARGDYMAGADLAGIDSIMNMLGDNPVVQQHARMPYASMKQAWDEIKNNPDTKPAFDAAVNPDAGPEMVRWMIDNGQLLPSPPLSRYGR